MYRNHCALKGYFENVYSKIKKKNLPVNQQLLRHITVQNLKKMLSNISLPRLSPYVDEIIRHHQRGFQHNKSTTDQIFCIHEILGIKMAVQ
jgi:hypothetical protein